MNDLTFHPVLPWLWLILLACAILALVGWSLRLAIKSRKTFATLAAIRLLAFGALLVLLLQPQRRSDIATPIRPQLAVLFDTSESMAERVDPQQMPRSDRVREWLQSAGLEKAGDDFDVRMFTFDRSLADAPADPVGLRFEGEASNLTTALDQVQQRFRAQPLAAILVLSDGLDTSVSQRLQTAAFPVPVHTFELERPFSELAATRHLSIASVDYPPRVVTGWDTNIRVNLAATGMAGQTVTLELWREDQRINEAPVSFNATEQTRQIVFPVTHDKPGTVKYELRLSDPAADKQSRNRPFVIEVLTPGNRVLYVQNTLGFDFKFLRRAIKADRNLQVNAYVRWGDGRIVSMDESADAAARTLDFSRDTLAPYSVLILGDLAPGALGPANWKAIRDFVDQGGGLVLLGGPNFLTSAEAGTGPAAELLPVVTPAEYREGSFALQITDTGMHHPVFGPLFSEVREFPPLLTCNLSNAVVPNAELLMQATVDGTPHPVVVSKRFGQGRVVTILSDTIWRWRLAAKGWATDRSPYDTFWAQLMDWLVPKEQERQNTSRIELFTERTGYLLGEKPEVRALVHTSGTRPSTLPLEIRTPDDKVFNYLLRPANFRTPAGRSVDGYSAEVEPNVPGVFEGHTSATLDTTKVGGELRFLVTQPVTELLGRPIDRELLRNLSAASNGGHFYQIDEWKNWRKDLHYEQQFISRAEMIDLWMNPWWPGLLLGMLALEWMARKLNNLP